MWKKLVLWVLMVTISLFAVTAYAATTRLANIDKLSASLVISGSATCHGKVTAKSDNATASITVTLQKQNTNGTWAIVNSWTASGTGSASVEKTQSISSGTYRVRSTGTVSGETMTVYSAERTK